MLTELQDTWGWTDLSEDERTKLFELVHDEGRRGSATSEVLTGLLNHPRWTSGWLWEVAGRQADGFRRTLNLVGEGEAPPDLSKDAVLARLEETDGFRALSASTQERLRRRVMLDGPRGEDERANLSATVGGPFFGLDSEERQGDWLRLSSLEGHSPRIAETLAKLESSAARDHAPGVVEDLLERVRRVSSQSLPRGALLGGGGVAGSKGNQPSPNHDLTLLVRLQELVLSSEFDRATGVDQTRVLKMLAEHGPGIQDGLDDAPSLAELGDRLVQFGALTYLDRQEREALRERMCRNGPEGRALRRLLAQTLDHAVGAELRTPQERAQSLRGYLHDTRRLRGSLWAEGAEIMMGIWPLIPLPDDAIEEIRSLPGFSELSSEERSTFEALLLAKRNSLSQEARRQAVILARRIEPDQPKVQESELRAFLTDGSYIPGRVDMIDVEQEPVHATKLGPAQRDFWAGLQWPPNITWPRDLRVAWTSWMSPVSYALEVGAKTIEVIGPRSPPDLSAGRGGPQMFLPTVEEIEKALARLPTESLARIERVVLYPFLSEEIPEAQAAVRRQSDGTVFFYPILTQADLDEVADVARHETGHLNQQATLDENERGWVSKLIGLSPPGPDWDAWERAGEADIIPVSRYGQHGSHGHQEPVEDHAEAYALYTGTQGTPIHAEFRTIFRHRFALLDETVR